MSPSHPKNHDTDPTANATFTLHCAPVEQNGLQQVIKVSFSRGDADYSEGGKLSLEMVGETVNVDRVDVDAGASVACLDLQRGAALRPTSRNASLVLPSPTSRWVEAPVPRNGAETVGLYAQNIQAMTQSNPNVELIGTSGISANGKAARAGGVT